MTNNQHVKILHGETKDWQLNIDSWSYLNERIAEESITFMAIWKNYWKGIVMLGKETELFGNL